MDEVTRVLHLVTDYSELNSYESQNSRFGQVFYYRDFMSAVNYGYYLMDRRLRILGEPKADFVFYHLDHRRLNLGSIFNRSLRPAWDDFVCWALPDALVVTQDPTCDPGNTYLNMRNESAFRRESGASNRLGLETWQSQRFESKAHRSHRCS